jgi:hypothetical protein
METFSQLKARLALEEQRPGFDRKVVRPLKQMILWLENTICNTQIKQRVVDNRHTEEGGRVTQEMFAKKAKAAHICPFVRDSLDADLFSFEESPAGREDGPAIEQRLRDMVQEFINAPPSFDPSTAGCGASPPTNLKTFFLVLPNLRLQGARGPDQLMDGLHETLKPIYVNQGLMLGQFYPTCDQGGIYNEEWLALTAPWPAFAARYMAKHDYLFVGDALMPVHHRYFPEQQPKLIPQQ